MNRAAKEFSNHWKFASRTFPIIGTLAAIFLIAACGTVKKFEATGPVTDAQIAQSVKSAQAAYQSGNFLRAAKCYELALARARALDDSAEIARNAYNAAACHLRSGHPSSASPLLVEAGREFERAGMDREPVLVLQAMTASALGQAAEATALASNAFAAAKSDVAQLDVLLVQLDLAVQHGDLDEAQRLLKMAQRRAEKSHSATMNARVAAAEGKLLQKSDAGKAAGKFDQAADGWRTAGNIREMADNLRAAGAAWQAAKKSADAADRFYRAARSYFGQNDRVAALACIDEAFKAADEAKSAELRGQIAALFEQIKKSVEPVTE